MNALQSHNASMLRKMAYRFNEISLDGSTIVLRQSVTLMTGTRLTREVARLTDDGHVEMGNVE